MLRAVCAVRALCSAAVLFATLSATPASAGDPLTLLGQKLFFDTRLSGSGRTACASCHEPRYGYAQQRRVAISDNGEIGKRNAPTIIDVRFYPTLMWDGRFPSLEHQVFGPFASGEMGIPIHHAAQRLRSDPQYLDLFRTALASPPTPDGMARAIAAFERTIVSRDSRVDRFIVNKETNILSPQERHGLEVFARRAECAACHQLFPVGPGGREHARPLFTDFRYHNVGAGHPRNAPDVGRIKETRNPADLGAFRTPSLRNAARTPPYMHDGSLGTLEEVVEFYNAGGQPNPNISPRIRPLNLSGAEKAALVAFLRALSD